MFKARLVTKAYRQLASIDYHETFSPVVKTVTVRIVLALTAVYNWNYIKWMCIMLFLRQIKKYTCNCLSDFINRGTTKSFGYLNHIRVNKPQDSGIKFKEALISGGYSQSWHVILYLQRNEIVNYLFY